MHVMDNNGQVIITNYLPYTNVYLCKYGVIIHEKLAAGLPAQIKYHIRAQ